MVAGVTVEVLPEEPGARAVAVLEGASVEVPAPAAMFGVEEVSGVDFVVAVAVDDSPLAGVSRCELPPPLVHAVNSTVAATSPMVHSAGRRPPFMLSLIAGTSFRRYQHQPIYPLRRRVPGLG
ncbi:hypothetical protein [Antricoccus suffuscus]|uniref:hypothetical protein n=1 Tax=Antricoccus suffuscus TaxID=1629062 RepID=UPI000D063678|nr:hypothetical protein [Antricoccus suffuscus]